MINTLIAEYLSARLHRCTLSVFLAESAVDECAVLTHEDILTMLKIKPGTLLHSAIESSKADGKENRASLVTLEVCSETRLRYSDQ